jgi:uncharacterized repeat protein (TIGR01451 family)
LAGGRIASNNQGKILFRGLMLLLAGLLGTVSPALAQTIAGRVYEDANYGGGAGRAWPGAGAGFTARDNARVELYDVTTGGGGTFVSFVNTAGGGLYSFAVTNGRNYRIRVVNLSVTSARTGYVAGLIPVSTYAGNDANAVNRVGGPTPQLADAANGAAGNTINGLTGANSAPATLSNTITAAGAITGVDFGFNFDVITTTRNNGVGSLRQFILNANALANTGLAQVGQTAGDEVTIYMVPDGAAHPGLLISTGGGPANQLTTGVVQHSYTDANGVLPTITGANTVIDGSTQTTNIGNTNVGITTAGPTLGKFLGSAANTSVGTGTDGILGTVDDYELPGTDAAEVLIQGPANADDAGTNYGFAVAANNVKIRSLIIRRFSSYGVVVPLASTASGLLIENIVFGANSATALGAPTGNNRLNQGVALLGRGTGITIRNNIFSVTRRAAVIVDGDDQNNPLTTVLIDGNELRQVGAVGGAGGAITATDQFSALTVRRNLVGVAAGGTYDGLSIVFSNTNVGNSSAGATSVLENSFLSLTANGIELTETPAGSAQNKQGAITSNVITGSAIDGIRHAAGTGSFTFSRNSINNNTGLGINLVGGAGVDLNDNGDGDTGPNGLFNYPVITSATILGANLELVGYARSNSVIEIFKNATPDGTSFGEGQTYVTTVTEAISDLDGTVGSYGPAAINGVLQGTDNTNRFRFLIPLPAGITTGDNLSATGTFAGNNASSEFSGQVVVALGVQLQGTVFEDVNYGGGVGRTYTAANTSATASGFTTGTIRRPNAIVERYNSSGTLLDTARTNANGLYTFKAVTAGTYTIRVVNSTVSSVRTGYVAGLLPVQTFVNGATDRVGGEAPQLVDAAANNPAAPVTLASLTTATTAPQSIATVTTAAVDVTGVDFGFNFDLVVSTRNTGQGSLRQFITNANALGNETFLAQSGSLRSALNGATTALTAQRETSIFMIPNGTAVPGLRVGLVNQLNASGVASITLASALPQVTGTGTIIDGRTQSFNLNNPNNLTLRAATTAGTSATALSVFNGLEVELIGNSAITNGLDLTTTALNARVAGLAIYGFGSAGAGNDILSNAVNAQITQNVVGTKADAFADPGAGRTGGVHIQIAAGTGVQVTQNLIGYGVGTGVLSIPAGATITGNEVRGNGTFAVTGQDGIDARGTATSITGNMVADNGGVGIELNASAGANSINNNTVTGNGRGAVETPGIRVGGANSIINQNIISGNYGAGVMVIATAATNRISQNSIFNNGTVLSLSGGAATGQLGIDLLAAANNQATGTAPYVTINDAADADAGGNGLLNFPILSGVSLSGGSLTVTGFAQPGTSVEFYIATPDASGFGEGETYLVTRVEGLVGDDTDSGTGTYGPGAINGKVQGTETTNRFSFTLPFSALTVAQQNAIIAGGLTATGTLSNATSEFSGIVNLLSIQGTVFEDVNYGGGAGRDYATADASAVGSGFTTGAIRRPNARVELYDGTGTFVQSTTTDAAGAYALPGVGAGNYTVRVVNNTVTSARPGSIVGLLPVQTYVVRGGAGDPNRVGGEAPEKVDAPSSGAAPNVLLEIVGLNPSGGDNTAFVDLVAITGAPTAVLNASFETPSQGGGYSYNTTGASWTFAGSSGLAANGSGFGPPAPPGGTQVAFVQFNGVASQSISLPAGSYTVTMRVAQRNCCATNNQQLDIRIDGVSVGTIQPLNNGAYATFTSSSFTVTAPAPVTLAALNTATTVAESQATVTVGSATVTGVDFGYSFDVISNTLNTGQGSLRQFLTNANTLTNANLAQAGQTAGRETTIFMIPNGTAVAGLRAGLVNQLTGAAGDARAVIALPASAATLTLTDAGTTIDGGTQTASVGNTNTGTLGTTEAVGLDALSVVPVAQPEIEIAGNTGIGSVIQLTGANATVRNIAVRGGTQSIGITGTGYLLENNIIGSSAIAHQWENDATVSTNFGIGITGTAVGTIQNNLVGYTGNSGIDIDNGLATVAVTTIQGNQFTQNGYTSAGGDAISLGDSGGSGPMLIQGNLFTRSNSSAVQFEIQQTAVSQVLNNTMVSCGKGGAGVALSSLEGSAICYLQRNGARRGTQADLISRNIIVDTQASGIVVGYGQSNVTISQNSIYNSGAIAIDLVYNPNAYVGGPGSGSVEYGSGDNVNLNEGTIATPPTPLPNRGTDYPVLTSLDVQGGNMIVTGFCRPGATVELFVPATDPTRFGEGRLYLYTRVEGSVDDTDGGTGAYGPAAINGLLQGQDAAASRFTFTMPFSSLPTTTQDAILNEGVTSTATLNGNTSELSGDVTLRSDVATTITGLASPVPAGLTAQFNVDFTNNGPSTANGIIAVVQLLPGLSGVVATNGGIYTSATGVVAYAGLTSLTAGQVFSSAITYTQPSTNGAVTGTASISTTTNQGGLYANDLSTATIFTAERYDLATTVSGPLTTLAGNQTTYGVTTINNGPLAVQNVVQTLTIPTGLTDVFMTNGGTYNSGTGVVTFPAIDGLAIAQVRNNSVSFRAPASNYTVTADVTPIVSDQNTTNNTASISTTVGAAAATATNAYVTVTSDAPAGGVAPGAPVTFTVNQGNYGPLTATGVQTRLSLAPGLSGVTISGGGTYSFTTGLVTWPTVASQATATSQTYTATVNAPASGLLTGTASVATTTADPVPADNVATTEVTITAVQTADARVTLSGPARAVAGQVLTYTVTTTNIGLNPALGANTSVLLPAGLTGVVISGGGTYSALTGIVSFPVVTTLNPGGSVTNTISFTAQLNDANALPLAATVNLTSTETNLANNAARTSVLLQAYADVSLNITGPTTTTVGSPVTYIVTATNAGPAVANGHALTVQLPTNLTGVVISAGGSYNAMSGVVSFPTNAINQLPGTVGSVVRTISFNAPDRAFISPVATAVVVGGDDPITTNNLTTITTGVSAATVARANLGVTVGSSLGTQTAGLPLTFTLTTTNSGPDPASSLVQQLALRPGLTGVTVNNGGTYDAVTGVVTWSDGLLANGGSLVRSVVVNAPGAGPLVATATVSGAETDLTQANNRATATVTITPSADVRTTINGPSVTDPGTAVVYSVTTINNGASPATNVIQTVTIPTGLTGVLITGGGTYNSGSGVVTFPTIAAQALNSAGAVTNTIAFTAPGTAFTVLANVSSSTTDPVGGNNSANQPTSTTSNQLPVARDVVNTLQAPRGETSTADNLISPLLATDPDGTISNFRILSLPPAGQGQLTIGGVPVVVNQLLTVAQASLLQFDPVTNFVGNAFFDFTAIDNVGGVGNRARYTVPVGRDNASVYTNAPIKGGPVPYLNNDDIATVFDANGGEYGAGPVVTDNGTRTVFLAGISAPLPPGVSLDPTTGRLFVSNNLLLVAGTYTVTITTIDELAGENTQPVTFTIGATPLPVELISFDAKPQGTDALLTWATASEQHSAYFAVERSTSPNGDYREVARRVAAGNSAHQLSYDARDAGVGRTAGIYYYRLRQVDTDGKTALSEVRPVRFTGGLTGTVLTVYPNPAQLAVTLDLSTAPAATYDAQIFDVTGRLIRTLSLVGGSRTPLAVQELPVGTYVVRVTGTDGAATNVRFVKE